MKTNTSSSGDFKDEPYIQDMITHVFESIDG